MKTKKTRKSYDNMYGEKMNMNEYDEVWSYIEKADKKKKVLDVGCGYGVFLEKYVKKGFGIDNIKGHVRICKDKGLNVVFGEAEKIPYKDNYFDCVVLMQVLEHSREPEKTFSEMNRVLKKGGIFICTTPSYMSPNSWGDSTHIRPYSTYGLRNLAIDNGFTVKNLYASSIIGENNIITRRICRGLANTKFFPYLQYILYLVCEK